MPTRCGGGSPIEPGRGAIRHTFAIALPIGSVVPLNFRLIGVWRSIPREAVVRVLAPVAASELTLALLTGPLLFSVRAREYGGVEFLQLKLTLIAVGILSTLALCRAHGVLLKDAPHPLGRPVRTFNDWLAGGTRLWTIDRVRGGLKSTSSGQHECAFYGSWQTATNYLNGPFDEWIADVQHHREAEHLKRTVETVEENSYHATLRSDHRLIGDKLRQDKKNGPVVGRQPGKAESLWTSRLERNLVVVHRIGSAVDRSWRHRLAVALH